MANASVPSSNINFVTGTYNKIAIGVHSSGDTLLAMTNGVSISVGETLHFIGSYQMKTS